MLYSPTQIDLILNSAYSTMWQLSEKAMGERLFYQEDIYSPEIPIIFDLTKAVEWAKDRFYSHSDFQGLVAYLKHKITGYGFATTTATQVAPVITTQPVSQSAAEGSDVTFTVVATGTLPLSYQWLKDGVAIPGATHTSYTAADVQPGDSGSVFTVTVSNQVGFANSTGATLTVTEAIAGQAYYGATDYYAELQLGLDNVPYNVSFDITHNAPLVVTFPSGAAVNMYQIYKVPIGESVKTLWRNTISDGGDIPGFVFNDPLTIGAFRYYTTSTQISINTDQPMTLS